MKNSKMFLILILSMQFSFLANAGELSFEEFQRIQEGIKNSNASQVAGVLRGKKSPFAANTTLFGEKLKGKSQYDQPDYMGDEYLKMALGMTLVDGKRIKKCDKSLVEVLADSGAPVKTYHLQGAVDQPCAEAIRLLANKLPDGEVASVITKYFGYITEKFGSMSSADQEEHENELAQFAEIGKAFSDLIKEKCPTEKSMGPICSSKSSIQKLGEAMKSQEAAEEHAQSPEGLIEQVCQLQLEIDEQNKIIEKEKSIGKVSGVVNQVVLHKAGSRIVELKSQMSEFKNIYAKKTKKTMSLKSCK